MNAWRSAIALVAAAMLGAATADLPIGYYTLLRIVVATACAVIIWLEYKSAGRWWALVLVPLVIVFNPIFPIYLHDKDTWMWIDWAACGLFVVYAIVASKPSSWGLNTNQKIAVSGIVVAAITALLVAWIVSSPESYSGSDRGAREPYGRERR